MISRFLTEELWRQLLFLAVLSDVVQLILMYT